MTPNSKIYIAGHLGLVGSALLRYLTAVGSTYHNIITRSHAELDLSSQQAVRNFFEKEQPEYVFLAAAKVGGILANHTYPAEFVYQNLAVQTNVIHESWHAGVKRLLFLGSSCIYPRDCPQPIQEKYLLTGPLEETNKAYAVAKIAGIEMCSAYNRQYDTKYLAVMPTNLYGPNDHYDLLNSHVLPTLIRKMHEAKLTDAKEVVLWGTGNPHREFLYSDDLAEACHFLMNLDDKRFSALLTQNISPIINVGYGEDITIRELAALIREIVGYMGDIIWDRNKPDGTPRKLLDLSQLNNLGWKSKTTLKEGIRKAYTAFIQEEKRSK